MLKIKELEQRLNRIEQEKALIRSKISQEKRKCDTKRKILYGVAALELASQDSELHRRLLKFLDSMLTRSEERALLDLPTHRAHGDDE